MNAQPRRARGGTLTLAVVCRVRVRGQRHTRTMHTVNYDAIVVELFESRMDRKVRATALYSSPALC